VLVYFAGPLFTEYERGFIGDCAERLRAEGFEVFVPHEHALLDAEATATGIFAADWAGLERADALLALLDGPSVDDGTACEIGVFHGLMRADPARKGIVGLLTDLRGARGGGGLNLFVRGCIEASGEVVPTLDDAVAVLRRWRAA
jgi:hypothetical protein